MSDVETDLSRVLAMPELQQKTAFEARRHQER